MRKILISLIAVLAIVAPACAQVFDLNLNRQPVTSLDGLWRFHTGDDPEWASPGFDDSQWTLLRSDEPWSSQGYPGYSGIAWYRFRLVVPAGVDRISLLLPRLLTSYQLYVDGKLAGSFGDMPPHAIARVPITCRYRIDLGNSSRPRVAVIALRVWHWPGWSKYLGGGPRSAGALGGQPDLIEARFRLLSNSQLLEQGGSYSLTLLTGIAGIVSLILFLIRRKETEYSWFAANQFGNCLLYVIAIYATIHAVPIIARDIADTFIEIFTNLSFILFLQKLLRGRRSLLFSLSVLAAFATLLFPLAVMQAISIGDFNLVAGMSVLVIFVWACDLMVRRIRDGMPDARLLLVPVLLALSLNAAGSILQGAFQLGWQKTSRGSFVLFEHPFAFSADELVKVLFLGAMLAILSSRFMRTRREEQRLAGELEAARTVQSFLVPAAGFDTPGFNVESVYLPANEVGGDFYHVQPRSDGSLLIVVGDVSGKGLKAAMTVSTIIGALRNQTEYRPARVLANLNRVLAGYVSGFVTCAAALIEPDGTLTLASAGHLPPYCNGEELTLESGTPLGILPDIFWVETKYQLAAGDRLTFVSDGVIEATNSKRELFGFDRARAISKEPASAIAETARQFGQEDDISVLSVTRVAAPVQAV